MKKFLFLGMLMSLMLLACTPMFANDQGSPPPIQQTSTEFTAPVMNMDIVMFDSIEMATPVIVWQNTVIPAAEYSVINEAAPIDNTSAFEFDRCRYEAITISNDFSALPLHLRHSRNFRQLFMTT
jgi:hypothetical protein